MRRKELSRAYRNALLLSVISFALAGCFETQSSGSGFVDQAEPAIAANRAPTISGNPPTSINVDSAYMFRPSASDVDNDVLTFAIRNKPSWADFDVASGELSGQPTLEHVGTYASIEISVSDGEAESALPRFAISVDQTGTISATLEWTPPTQNEDGSVLTDLAGYKIFWGKVRGQYTHSVTINNPGISSYVVDNLSPGTYEFASKSFNTDGTESVFSNPVVKVLN